MNHRTKVIAIFYLLAVAPATQAMKRAHCSSEAELYNAIYAEDVAQVEILLQYEPDVNTCKHDGSSLLQLAAQQGNQEIVRLLLTKGSGLATGAQHATSTVPSSRFAERVARATAQRYAEINDMRTPLHYAAASKSVDAPAVIGRLIKNGADLNAQDSRYGFTPLHIAVRNHCMRAVDIVRRLATAGANLEIRNKFNNTPLQDAVLDYNYHLELIRALVENGANIFVRNVDGSGPTLIDRINDPELAHKIRYAHRFHTIQQVRQLYATNLQYALKRGYLEARWITDTLRLHLQLTSHANPYATRPPLPATVVAHIVSFCTAPKEVDPLLLQEDAKFKRRLTLPANMPHHWRQQHHPLTMHDLAVESLYDRELANRLELTNRAERELQVIMRNTQKEKVALTEQNSRNQLIAEETREVRRIKR